MSDLKSLDELIAKRRGGRGQLRYETGICMDFELLEELTALGREEAGLRDQRDQIIEQADKASAGRMVTVEPDTAEVDQLLANLAKERTRLEAATAAQTLYLTFTPLSSKEYQTLSGKYPEADDDLEQERAFYEELCNLCLESVTFGDEPTTKTWSDLVDVLSQGEVEPIQVEVLAINKRTFNIPKSWKGSGKTR